MGSRVIPVRLDDDDLAFIDLLVKLGIYRSRSEAIRELIRAGMRSHEDIVKVAKAVEELFRMEREEGAIPIRLDGALKQLLRERERFQ